MAIAYSLVKGTSPAFSLPMCGKFNAVVLQHACRATSLQDQQFQHGGPCELRPVHALFFCPRLSRLHHLQSWPYPQFPRPNALSDQFCQALFAFPKCIKEVASALCNSHLCSSFVLAESLGG